MNFVSRLHPSLEPDAHTTTTTTSTCPTQDRLLPTCTSRPLTADRTYTAPPRYTHTTGQRIYELIYERTTAGRCHRVARATVLRVTSRGARQSIIFRFGGGAIYFYLRIFPHFSPPVFFTFFFLLFPSFRFFLPSSVTAL